MPVDIKRAFAKVLAEIENDEAEERLKSLEGRSFTARDIAAALRGASDEEKEDLRAALVESGIGEAEAEKIVEGPPALPDDGSLSGGDGSSGESKPPAPPKPKKTRPGRKAGNAYAWTVDDDGNVSKTGTAVVYSGEDEPDEVELP